MRETYGIGESALDTVAHWERAGADQLNLMVQSAEVLPQDVVLESIRLFGREVLPKFSAAGLADAKRTA